MEFDLKLLPRISLGILLGIIPWVFVRMSSAISLRVPLEFPIAIPPEVLGRVPVGIAPLIFFHVFL